MREAVLLIEDDLDVREIVGQAITDAGYTAVGISRGKAAVEYLRSNPPPKLVLMDWHVPDLGGAEIIEQMKAPELAATPVVLMTGDREVDASPEARFAGHLAKPFTWDALLKVLDRFLPQPQV